MKNNDNPNNINFDDQEMPSSAKASEIDEIDETDIKLIKLLKMDDIPEPPQFIKENVLKAYRNEFRYRILWTKIKDRLTELASLNPDTFVVRQLPLVLASVLIFITLSIILSYRYQASISTNPGNFISNQQTPAINTSPTPIPNPEVLPSATPNIVENNKPNNDNKLNTNIENRTYQQNVIVGEKKIHKPETSKDLDIEKDKVAVNRVKDGRGPINEVRGVNSKPGITAQESVTLSELVYVGVAPLKIKDHEIEPIDLEIGKELTEAIDSNSKWKLPSEPNKPQAVFVKQQTDGALVLVNSNKKVLWKDENYIENYQKDKNYIKSVVNSLTENK